MSPSLLAIVAARSVAPCLSSYLGRGGVHELAHAVASGKRGKMAAFSSSAAFASNRHDEYDDDDRITGSSDGNCGEGETCAEPVQRHCETCTCDTEEHQKQQHLHLEHSQCHIPPTAMSDTLPPPLPEPKYSFHKRLMPKNLVALSSKAGRARFLESLITGNAEAYLPLAEQFLNQSDPAYCGVTTLAMVLNACAVDPNVRWRGGWRWYGSDDVVLDRCCLGSERGRERVRRAGITLEEFAALGRCQGLGIEMKRPCLDTSKEAGFSTFNGGGDAANELGRGQQDTQCWTLDDFRFDVQHMVKSPPFAQEENADEGRVPNALDFQRNDASSEKDESNTRGFLVVSFSRAHLNQTGAGHFSPVAAYHPPSDSCLILDVARFKYSPYWVSIGELYGAMGPIDDSTCKSRGWFVIKPPKVERSNVFGYQGISKRDEGMRPAAFVPLVRSKGTGTGNVDSATGPSKDTCPIASMKIEFCSIEQIEESK